MLHCILQYKSPGAELLFHLKHFMFSIKYEFMKFVNHCSVFIYILPYFLEFGLFFTLRYLQ